MSPNNEKIASEFQACTELTGEELRLKLQHLKGCDEAVYHEVTALLHADQQNSEDGRFLEWAMGPLPNQLEPETKVGSYIVTAYLGSGSTAEVYRAIAPDGTDVALKFLLPWARTPRHLARFANEQETLRKIQHPNVAELLDYGIYDSKPFLVTQFIDGVTLKERIAQSPDLDVRIKINWIIGICRGVAAIHERLVLHRDLKPSNILIGPNDAPVVTDFGIAKQLNQAGVAESLTLTGELVGTPKFMAPEQLSNSSGLGLATDVYGIGAVMYFALTALPPIDGHTLVEITDKIRDSSPLDPIKLAPNVDRDLSTICLKCLSKAPSQRYQSADELESDLRLWSLGKPITSRQIGLVERSHYLIRRNKTVSLLALALITAVIVGLASTTYFWQRAEANFEYAASQGMKAVSKNDKLMAILENLIELENETTLSRLDLKSRRDVLKTIAAGYEAVDASDNRTKKAKAVAWLKLGRAEWGMGNSNESFEAIENARKIFQRLNREQPDNTEYQFDIFHCLKDQQRYSEALQCIEELVAVSPDNENFKDALSHANMLVGNQLLRLGKHSQAIERYNRARDISAQLIPASSLRKTLLFKKKLAEIAYARGHALLSSNQIEAAKKDFLNSVRVFGQCRKESDELNFDIGIIRKELDAFFFLTALNGVSGDLSGALEFAVLADNLSVEFSNKFGGFPGTNVRRYRSLSDLAYLGFLMDDRQVLEKNANAAREFLLQWRASNVFPERANLCYANFLTNSLINPQPDFDLARSIIHDNQNPKGAPARMRIALHSRDYDSAEDNLETIRKTYHPSYYDFYRISIENLKENAELGKPELPDQSACCRALALGRYFHEAMAFRHLSFELEAWGQQR